MLEETELDEPIVMAMMRAFATRDAVADCPLPSSALVPAFLLKESADDAATLAEFIEASVLGKERQKEARKRRAELRTKVQHVVDGMVRDATMAGFVGGPPRKQKEPT